MKIDIKPVTNNLAKKYRPIFITETTKFADKHHINPDLTVCFSFITATRIRTLNSKYRKIDKTTDVLSFPLWNDLASIPSKGEVNLGDVYICPTVISSNAKLAGLKFEEELRHIIRHSLNHLIGIHH